VNAFINKPCSSDVTKVDTHGRKICGEASFYAKENKSMVEKLSIMPTTTREEGRKELCSSQRFVVSRLKGHARNSPVQATFLLSVYDLSSLQFAWWAS